jgi:hypothetical protein
MSDTPDPETLNEEPAGSLVGPDAVPSNNTPDDGTGQPEAEPVEGYDAIVAERRERAQEIMDRDKDLESPVPGNDFSPGEGPNAAQEQTYPEPADTEVVEDYEGEEEDETLLTKWTNPYDSVDDADTEPQPEVVDPSDL